MAKPPQPLDVGRTEFRRVEMYKDRWASRDNDSGILALSDDKLSPSQLQRYDLFKDYDEEFLERISPDVSVAKWRKGSIFFEEGAYLDLAFFIVQGEVEFFVSALSERSRLSMPIFDDSRTRISEGPEPFRLATPVAAASERVVLPSQLRKPESSRSITFLSSIDIVSLPAGGEGFKLRPGEIFGEIGAMSGWPQSVTARAATECELVQIRMPALRLMKNESKAFKERLDRVYRKRALAVQLKNTPLLQDCDESFIQELTREVELVSCKPDEIVTREGGPVDALYLVRSGFLKLSQRLEEGQIVVSYLSKGMTFGEAELLLDEIRGWTCTASSVEYTELIRISRDKFNKLVNNYPAIKRQLWGAAVARIKETGANRKYVNRSEFIQTALEKGLVQGNSILVIDLETCTRCDDCVRGCADTHGGLPRFVREGDKYENLLITKACYHCRDPVCLVGCPTGAIHRAGVGAVVEIEDNICIGCQACARNCPYDAIVMHEIGEIWPEDMIPEGLRGKVRLLASKCDLCYKTNHGPACVNNCPHGCAIRVGSLEEFQGLLAKHE